MEKKSVPEEGNARRRRNNTTIAQQREQQREWERQRERAWISGTQPASKSKAAALLAKNKAKKSSAVSFVAPTGKNNKSKSNINIHAKRHTRSSRDQMQHPVALTSGTAFRRSRSTLPALGQSSNQLHATVSKANKKKRPKLQPMEKAHEQLDQMLTRIEQDGDEETPVTRRQQQQQRCKPLAPGKQVRRQMKNTPPVPTGTPLNSARHTQLKVPLTQTPQSVLQTLARADQQDQQPKQQQNSESNDHDGDSDIMSGTPSKDSLEPLELTPGVSPYHNRIWLARPQKKQPAPQSKDKVAKIKSDPNDKILLDKKRKDEKHVLDPIESQPAIIDPAQAALQQQAMDERMEMERQKQMVAECRVKHRLDEMMRAEQEVTQRLLKKAKQMKKDQKKQAENAQDPKDDSKITPPPPTVKKNMNFMEEALRQRQQFHEQCQRSPMYNSPTFPEPWSLFSDISYSLSTQLMEDIDAEIHRNIVKVFRDMVEEEIRAARRPH